MPPPTKVLVACGRHRTSAKTTLCRRASLCAVGGINFFRLDFCVHRLTLFSGSIVGAMCFIVGGSKRRPPQNTHNAACRYTIVSRWGRRRHLYDDDDCFFLSQQKFRLSHHATLHRKISFLYTQWTKARLRNLGSVKRICQKYQFHRSLHLLS